MHSADAGTFHVSWDSVSGKPKVDAWDPPSAAIVQPWADKDATTRELTRSNSTQLGRDMLAALEGGAPIVVLDCRATGYISSFGLATIVRLSKLARDHQSRLVVVGLNDDLVALFRQVQLEKIVETCTEAIWRAAGGVL